MKGRGDIDPLCGVVEAAEDRSIGVDAEFSELICVDLGITGI